VAAYRSLPEYKWGVVVTQPRDLAFSKKNRQLRNLVFGYLAYAVLFFMVIGLVLYALVQQKKSEDAVRALNEELQVLSLTDPLTGLLTAAGSSCRLTVILKWPRAITRTDCFVHRYR